MFSVADKLAAALRDAGAPIDMVMRAEAGYYGDFTSPLAFPIKTLINDCLSVGLAELAKRAQDGDFDG